MNESAKRKHKRIDKPYLVRFRIKLHASHENANTDWDMVPVRDLSATGIFFLCKEDLGTNSLLDLKIEISNHVPTICCTGTVIRIKKHLNSPMFGVAVEFMDIPEKDKEMINKAVEECL